MANKQIKQLDETTSTQSSDLFVVQRNSSDVTNKVQASNMLPSASVTPDKLEATAGTSWEWVDYTPAVTYTTSGSMTIGDGVLKARYTIIGKTVKGNVYIKPGSSTTLGSGNMQVAMPIAISTNAFWDTISGSGASHVLGNGFLRNLGTESWIVTVNYSIDNGSNMQFTAFNATDSGTTITNNAPFTLGSSDSLRFNFEYEID